VGARPGAPRAADRAPWRGPTRRYDILKEGTIASVIILALTAGLAALLSSPDVPPVTVASWVQAASADFLGTAAEHPVRPGEHPRRAAAHRPGADLRPVAPGQRGADRPGARATLSAYNAASPAQQVTWATTYGNALTKVTFTADGTPVVPAANDGPVPVLLATELTLARSGAIDADLPAGQQFYGTNLTKPLLFLEASSNAEASAAALRAGSPMPTPT
jgi:hypothetical protein